VCPEKRNSFASPFFLPLRHVEAALAAPPGRLAIDAAGAEALLRRELRCHRCGGGGANMPPRLKEHIAACAAPLPDDDAGAAAAEGHHGA
jgi:hypothetical protein